MIYGKPQEILTKKREKRINSFLGQAASKDTEIGSQTAREMCPHLLCCGYCPLG